MASVRHRLQNPFAKPGKMSQEDTAALSLSEGVRTAARRVPNRVTNMNLLLQDKA